MSDKGFWIKTSKPTHPPNEVPLVEGYFSKKGNYMSGKRYFKLYSDSIYYFDVNMRCFLERNQQIFNPVIYFFINFRKKILNILRDILS